MDTQPGDERAEQALPIACDLHALGAERQLHEDVVKQLFANQEDVQELPNGFAFRFAAADYERVTSFIARERRCCPFFTFRLTLPPVEAPLTLEVTGPDGAKDLLQMLAQAGTQQQAFQWAIIPLTPQA